LNDINGRIQAKHHVEEMRAVRESPRTPPAVTLLLSTSLNSTAIAHSGGKGNNGYGNGGWDGSPNGKEDRDR